MAKTLPSNMILEKNKIASANPWVILLQIVLKEAGVTQQTFYLTNNNENVTYQAQEYTAFPFLLEPTKQSGKGEIPTVSLQVGNVTGVIQEYLEALEGGVGSQVKVMVVLLEKNNGGWDVTGDTELEMDFDVLSTESTDEWINFTLGAPNPLRMRFPKYEYIAEHCNWEFKSKECGYTGGETNCNRTWTRCDELNNTERFGGFPGLRPSGVRFV
jgi:lambda family phage minor tail protein L